jgi:hypothetical protein
MHMHTHAWCVCMYIDTRMRARMHPSHSIRHEIYGVCVFVCVCVCVYVYVYVYVYIQVFMCTRISWNGVSCKIH